MRHTPAVAALLTALTCAAAPLRPPAVPLVTCDPYFSIWSPADRLADADTTHWTGKPHRLTAAVTIDGRAMRLLGTAPAELPALPQQETQVLPTRTICRFEGAGVRLTVTFTTPMLPESIDLLSRPVTYVTFAASSADGAAHDVSVSFAAAGEIAANTPDQEVDWSRADTAGLVVLKAGTREQPVLAKRGDDLRIDWGYLYLAAPAGATVDGHALRLDLGKVGADAVSRWLMLAYDDLFSIQYMGENLRPFWRRNGWEAADLLKASLAERAGLEERCARFDAELMADFEKAGGASYAALAALAFRQCFAAGKFVADAGGQPLQFSKENHSNGCIATSDVFYPMAPQFLLFGPSLAKSFLVPFMNYAASPRWKFPFAPHDLGQYPHANGQVYGGGERTEDNQMPVEESGNLLILMAAVARMEGDARFAELYWPQLETWAAYLREKGFDPENQLCTDDFAGHLAHNVNLSAKAICGLGAFALLCEMRGLKEPAAEYRALAADFARKWAAAADDGDHLRLAFDRPGTWSQKYNLVWDRLLGLGLFPDAVLRKEMTHYRASQKRYGLPLDNRKEYTKLDWILWTATLTRDRADFDALLNPVIAFLNETPDRSPMTDWYEAGDARKVGFTARPVVGGVLLQMLYDRDVWSKWAGRDTTRASGWAPMPLPPVLVPVVPTAREDAAVQWRYVTADPGEGWMNPGHDVAQWKTGKGGFGTPETPGSVVGTRWDTGDIWLRRDFEWVEAGAGRVVFAVHHDEDVEIFINGVPAARAGGYTTDYTVLDLTPAARATLRPGRNLLAVRCRQQTGGQFIDVGISRVQKPPR